MTTLHHLIPIGAPIDKVYAAVATQVGMRGWWTADTVMDSKVGGKAEFGFDKRAMVFRMTIETLERDKRVVMHCHGDHPEWNGTVLTFTIESGEDGTILRFDHSKWRDNTDFCAGCNTTWGELMHRLKKWAEGIKPGPHWTE